MAMKRLLFFFPVVLSLVLLGAHFLRYGNSIGVFASLLLIALLMVRRRWVARLMQIALVLGTLEWVRTLHELAQIRAATGQPFIRMTVILGIVAAVTFCSALLFQSGVMKRFYGQDRSET